MYSSKLFANSAFFSVKDAHEYLTSYNSYITWNEVEETILEVGCSDGFVTRKVLYPYLDRHLKVLHSVDIDEEVIKLAEANNDKSKLRFACMDISDQVAISNFKNKYDHIFSLYCFHWVPDLKWLGNTYAMLKPGGQLFASILITSPFHAVINMQMSENKRWSKFLNIDKVLMNCGNRPDDYLRRLLTDTGYKIDVIHLLKRRRMSFTSIKNIKDAYASANVFVEQLPQDMLDDYMEDFHNKLLTFFKRCDDNNSYYSRQDIAIIIATK